MPVSSGRAASAEAIDALLPQTQCRKCGYDGCRPYAEAIASGSAGIDRCPPGGDEGIRALADCLDLPVIPLDPAVGRAGPRTVAGIEEAHCIGCTLCIQACPVDAIAGAARLMHTVIREACTGCELCIPPCPVDCIRLEVRAPQPDAAERRAEANAARARYEAHQRRMERRRAEEAAARVARKESAGRKQETIARALARARERLAARTR